MPEFWKPSVATDLVILGTDWKDEIRQLLIKRGAEPFKGKWALPGGFHQEDDEDLEHCAVRELREETGLIVEKHMIHLLTVRSAKDRDPRQNRVISVSYLYIVDGLLPKVTGGDDAAHAEWCEIRAIDPKDLAFDHAEICKLGIEEAFNIVPCVSRFFASLQRINPFPDHTSEP